ncbi:MAG: hypothetical protein C0179_04940 [Fervidicoccus sp.]|nr:MAG: hypothetical protein C0179_04940 [Fervidicoccus sp.]
MLWGGDMSDMSVVVFTKYDEERKIRYFIEHGEREDTKLIRLRKRILPMFSDNLDRYFEVVWEITYSKPSTLTVKVYTDSDIKEWVGAISEMKIDLFIAREPWFIDLRKITESIDAVGVRRTMMRILYELVNYIRYDGLRIDELKECVRARW